MSWEHLSQSLPFSACWLGLGGVKRASHECSAAYSDIACPSVGDNDADGFLANVLAAELARTVA